MMDPSDMANALCVLVRYCEEVHNEDVGWDAIEERFSASVYPPILLKVVKTNFLKKDDGEALFLFALDALVVAFARHLFARQGGGQWDTFPEWSVSDFSTVWESFVPASVLESVHFRSTEGTEHFLRLTHGYIVSVGGHASRVNNSRIVFAPKEFLPFSVPNRLKVLFDIKPDNWPASSLKAYMDPFITATHPFGQVVARYTRELNVPGEPVVYSALV
ncbi:hypothetical protein AGDE_09103 [Angomonas deanei]|uniref:Sister chromatid cohesion protein Dcc1, putative n=1 Tax=Angomonas deanei TaxID=59799 RepID=A0A7G2CFM4_9TRYP|nr:hypothetical protein AGDE_09103 [Angomonas deanei]CAD2218329.1 Sister chromatid cohesion protein Dcc1, putative [Angomonas deanei]|eukprot:EPY31336.1 hypothetical protein AGDE_09103 [Angomonas deanei]